MNTANSPKKFDIYPFILDDKNQQLSTFIDETIQNPQFTGNENIKIYESQTFCTFAKINNAKQLKPIITNYLKNKTTVIIDINDQVVKRKDQKDFLSKDHQYRSVMMNTVPKPFTYSTNKAMLQIVESDAKLSIAAQKLTIFKGGYFNTLHVDENNYGNINWMPSFCEGSAKLWFFPKESTIRSNKFLLRQFDLLDKFTQIMTIVQRKSEFNIVVQYPGCVLEFIPCGIPHAVLTIFNSSINKQLCTMQVALITTTYVSWWSSISNPISFGKKRTSDDYSSCCLSYTEWSRTKKEELLRLTTSGIV
jgi:hypothetical protein